MMRRTRIALIASLAVSCATTGGTSGTFYTSEQARLVQRSLNEHGYPVEFTGYYDPRTRAAVKAFQRSRGMEATGDTNAPTARALGLAPDVVAPTRDDDWIQDQIQYDAWHNGGP